MKKYISVNLDKRKGFLVIKKGSIKMVLLSLDFRNSLLSSRDKLYEYDPLQYHSIL